MMRVPYLYCQLGGNFCRLSGFAFQPASLSIVHAGSTYPFSGTFDAFGYFVADLQNAGAPIFLQAGDTISASNVTADTLPTITSAVNFNTNVVKGMIKGYPYKYFELWAYTLCSCSSYLLYSRLNRLSQYSGDFTSQVDLVNGQATNIEVYFVNIKTGNITDYVRSYGP